MINVGQIKKFKLFDSIIYCVVEKFNKKEIVIGDLEYIKHEINRYYVIVEESGINEVVTIDKIIRKCVKIVIDSEIYLTYCISTEEHD